MVLARTSLPPCFSVIAMPARAPSLPDAGSSRQSYTGDVSRGSHSLANSGSARNAGTIE